MTKKRDLLNKSLEDEFSAKAKRRSETLYAMMGREPQSPRDTEIPIDKIKTKAQPRTYFDPGYIAELAKSIEQNGLIEPVIINEKHELIAGECRLRACKTLGHETIKAHTIQGLTAQDAFILSMVENLQRNALRTIEIADACQRLKSEFNLSIRGMEDKTGIPRSSIQRYLEIFQKLDKAAIDALRNARADIGIAKIRALYTLSKKQRIAAINRFEAGQAISVAVRATAPSKPVNLTRKLSAYSKMISKLDSVDLEIDEQTLEQVDTLIKQLEKIKKQIAGKK